MKAFTLIILIVFLGLFFYCHISAYAAQTNWPSAKPPAEAGKRSVEVRGNKLIMKRDKKADREFPIMFDIADRSRKHKEGKKKKQ